MIRLSKVYSEDALVDATYIDNQLVELSKNDYIRLNSLVNLCPSKSLTTSGILKYLYPKGVSLCINEMVQVYFVIVNGNITHIYLNIKDIPNTISNCKILKKWVPRHDIIGDKRRLIKIDLMKIIPSEGSLCTNALITDIQKYSNYPANFRQFSSKREALNEGYYWVIQELVCYKGSRETGRTIGYAKYGKDAKKLCRSLYLAGYTGGLKATCLIPERYDL